MNFFHSNVPLAVYEFQLNCGCSQSVLETKIVLFHTLSTKQLVKISKLFLPRAKSLEQVLTNNTDHISMIISQMSNVQFDKLLDARSLFFSSSIWKSFEIASQNSNHLLAECVFADESIEHFYFDCDTVFNVATRKN